MEESQPLSEVEILKTTLCFKEHELFTLRSELERRNQEYPLLALSIERLEKTTAAYHDRLLRKLERMTRPVDADSHRRTRHRDDARR